MAAKKKKKTSNQLEIQNACKTLYANIQFASVDNPIRCIAVTSSIPNEGKTTAALNLAQAVAQSGKRTLLVEADMRRRSLADMMGISARSGQYAVMAGKASLASAVVTTATPNLWFLDVEPNIPNPVDLISSKAYAHLVGELSAAYDFVIFDTPPVGTFVDAASLSRLVDGVIMVVKVGGPKRDEIVNAYEQLQKAEANVLGVCATFCEKSGSEYYYAYYNKDNKRVDPDKEPRVHGHGHRSQQAAPQTAARRGVPAGQARAVAPAAVNRAGSGAAPAATAVAGRAGAQGRGAAAGAAAGTGAQAKKPQFTMPTNKRGR